MSKQWNVAGAFLGAAAGLAGAGYYWLLRRPLPKATGSLELDGLAAPVEIIRDDRGTPHIYAATEADALFAQGVVHAQDRLWQLDFGRRLVAGRLAEIFGEVALPLDRWVRTLSFRHTAEQEYALLNPTVRPLLDAYIAGINARISRGRLPAEFRLLRYEPEPWTPADSLGWVKFMGWHLSVNWESELLRARLIDRLGPERAADLDPDYGGVSAGRPPATVIPPDIDPAALGLGALDRARAATPFTGPPGHQGGGSNNWVIAGKRTATGAPLLANDMHLPLGIPAIWYENHLIAAGQTPINITGCTFPGIPYVVAGHNGRVAWGFTNAFADVQDLFQEHLKWENGAACYEVAGRWEPAAVRTETILVKGVGEKTETVITTRHGPIINAIAAEWAGEAPLALRWPALEPDTMFHALHAMNHAADARAFRRALRDWTGPIQNVVYADTAGNIAYTMPGKLPQRRPGHDGQVPAPGWPADAEWTGYVPFAELPHLANPPSGAIITANNAVAPPDYPHYIGREFALGDRAQRIADLLADRRALTVADMQAIQLDTLSLTAQRVAACLAQHRSADPEVTAVLHLLRHWDGTLTPDSAPAALYHVFLRRFIRRLLDDPLGDLADLYAGQGPTPVLAEGTLFGARAWDWAARTLEQPDSPWYTPAGGYDAVIETTLRDTIAFLKEELGPTPDDWAWGALHTLTLTHIIGRGTPLDRLFNRGPFPIGGDFTTVNAAGSALQSLDSSVIMAAPYRFIIDLADFDRSVSRLIPGQSGQPGSPHYDDQLAPWLAGAYHPMPYSRTAVAAHATATLHLLPAHDPSS